MMKKTEAWLGALAGLALALSMAFAPALGLDSDRAWGGARSVLFAAGALLFAFSFLSSDHPLALKLPRREEIRLYLSAAALFAAVILYYVWCVTIGLWTRWFYETNYYDLQAEAFLSGSLALKVTPAPELLALRIPDVYEPANREGVPVLWDATFYKGQYYLYWGPVPALTLLPVKLFYDGEIGDNVLTFVFVSGTFLFSALIVLFLRKQYYPDAPLWAVWLVLLLVGTANPLPYILFEPRIYEASVSAAQCFLVGGMYFLLLMFDRPSTGKLALAGVFFAGAVGSRVAALPAVAFLALMTLVWTLQTRRGEALRLLLAMATPLAIGALAYALYNYARFDSPFEFGARYQLTSYNQYDGKMLSFAYIPPNLYKTLLNPFEIRRAFPYIFPHRWAGPAWLAERNYPGLYSLFAESVTGVLVGSPFVVFAALAWLNRDGNLRRAALALGASAAASFFVLQLYFFASMRYLLDFAPSLNLLAAIGFWQGLRAARANRGASFFFALSGVLLCVYGMALSGALSISAHLEAWRGVNREMLLELTLLFNRLLKFR